jgi:hypothetical protein
MIVVTRIPTERNDGSKVRRREVLKLLEPVRKAFTGYSLEGPFLGTWVDREGTVYQERSYKLEVVVPRERVEEARQLFMVIGRQLGQRAIYFDAREGGEIIDLEEGEHEP